MISDCRFATVAAMRTPFDACSRLAIGLPAFGLCWKRKCTLLG